MEWLILRKELRKLNKLVLMAWLTPISLACGDLCSNLHSINVSEVLTRERHSIYKGAIHRVLYIYDTGETTIRSELTKLSRLCVRCAIECYVMGIFRSLEMYNNWSIHWFCIAYHTVRLTPFQNHQKYWEQPQYPDRTCYQIAHQTP